ncbi:MAG: VWD domain-containing protein [Candidatus Limnocylindrales bacterium]
MTDSQPSFHARPVRSLIAGLLTAAIVAACSSTPPTASPGASAAPFGSADVTAAVQTLASAGVAVRVRPADAPLLTPTGQSRVALLRFQVRNLALDARGGGLRGSELDEVAVANGGLPASYLIAAWAEGAGTLAAAAGSKLLGEMTSTDPPAMRFPGLAVALFLADTLPDPATATGTPKLAAVGQVAAAPIGFCDEVGAYLSGVLEGMLDPTQALAPAWLEGAIDRYALLESDPVKLRNAVAATAMLVYATSISRPWVVEMVTSPGAVHYLVGDEGQLTGVPPNSVRIGVDAGDGTFADEVNGCAELASAQLAETDVDGSPVTWIMPRLEGHAEEIPIDDIDDELDENGAAGVEYTTLDETTKMHDEGTEERELVVVWAFIERQDVTSLKALVEQLIGGTGILAPNSRAVYDRVKPQLDSLLVPRAWEQVDVSWHEALEPSPSPSPPQPCAAGCAGSNGDPHLRTVNGVRYDFQAAGEFTLLRSQDGLTEIQARQEPVSVGRGVAMNTAIVVRSGDHRIGVYATKAGTTVRLDGQPVDASGPTDLGGGLRLSIRRSGVEVGLPDGTVIYAMAFGRINLQIAPSDAMRRAAVGILGPVPDGASLPALPDGTVLPVDGDRVPFLYGPFADGWQVTDSTSLFDYEQGTSSATFAKPEFPSPDDIVTIDRLDPGVRVAGETACSTVADPGLHEECVFDVAITGDLGYVAGYDLTDQFFRTGTEAFGQPDDPVGPQPAASATPLPVGPLSEGIVEVLPSVARLLGSAMGPDGTLYLSVQLAQGTFEVVAADPKTGRITARVEAQGGGQVALTAGAVWVGEFAGGPACSVTRLQPATLVVEATIATACTTFYTELAATANALWYQDTAGLRAGDPGAKVRWIDPATNKVSGSVDLPSTVVPDRATDLRATDTAVFFGFDSDAGYSELRLRVGQDRFTSVRTPGSRTLVAGDGIWVQEVAAASFYSTGGVADRTIQIEGSLVAADERALYVQRFGAQGSVQELWRHPLDGQSPTRLASGATIGSAWGDRRLDYFDGGPILSAPSALVKLWLVYASEDTSESRVLAQWTRRE